MKTLFAIGTLALALTMSGCGKVRSSRLFSANGIFSGIGGLSEPTQRNLNQTELAIANKICAALKTKRTTLEATPSGSVAYRFNLENRDCSNKVISSQNITTSILNAGTDLEYSTSDVSNYFIDVVTDNSPFIASVCSQVLDTSTTIDKKVISNSIVLLDKLYTVTFTVDANSYNTIEVTTRMKDSNGAFSPLNSQSIKVATETSQLGAKFIGVEKERSMFTACNAKTFTTQKETWINAVSPL